MAVALANKPTGAIAPRAAREFSLADLEKLSAYMAQSGFFKDIKTAAQAMVKLIAGSELGLNIFQSLSMLHVIEGNIEMHATLLAAKVRGSGVYDYKILSHTNEGCKIAFYSVQNGQKTLIDTSEFTKEDAKTAGLAGKAMYGKYGRNMYFARAMSNGVKWHCPDLIGMSVYTLGEISGLVEGEPGNPVEVPETIETTVTPKALAQLNPADPIAPEQLAYLSRLRNKAHLNNDDVHKAVLAISDNRTGDVRELTRGEAKQMLTELRAATKAS